MFKNDICIHSCMCVLRSFTYILTKKFRLSFLKKRIDKITKLGIHKYLNICTKKSSVYFHDTPIFIRECIREW